MKPLVHASFDDRNAICGHPLRAFGDDFLVNPDTFTEHRTRDEVRCWECKSILSVD